MRDSKVLCKLLNEYEATALWFPTILTIPDKELLGLLDAGGHEIGCQVIWDEDEIEKLQAEIGREIRFYVIHGTGTLINKLLWRRLRPPSVESREIVRVRGASINFDKFCYRHSPHAILKMFKKLSRKTIIVAHPTYINRSSILSKKGPTLGMFSFLLKNGIRFEKMRIK